MQLAITLASLAAITSASPLAARGYKPKPGPWTLGAWHPSMVAPSSPPRPWVGEGINANGGRFYIGKEPSAYCPKNVEGLDCSLYTGGDRTWLLGGAYPEHNGTLSLHVGVPGGQQVYIAPDGALGFTTAHSAMMPEGSVTVGWSREVSVAGGAPTVVGFVDSDEFWYGAYGCTVEGQEGVYQIFMYKANKVPAEKKCVPFQMRTYSQCCSETDPAPAWQYT